MFSDIPDLIIVFFFLSGLILGSFGNVLILRLPAGRSIGGRSGCPKCGRTLRIIDLIPVLSFVMLGARCRSCQKKISWQYPLVEIASGCLFVIALYASLQTGTSSLIVVILTALCLWLLLLIGVTDARTATIPDALSVPLIILALLRTYLIGGSIIIPAAIGGGFFAVQWIASRGRWVGSGDILLAAGIGAFLGSVPLLLFSLWISYVAGALVAVSLLLGKKKTMNGRLAFGPFLVAGAMVSFVSGDRILGMIFG